MTRLHPQRSFLGGLREDGERKLVTHGQQTLIRVDRSAQ
jgi:hypothetical protein